MPQNHSELILASGSPRRKELLSQIGLKALVCPPLLDEESFSCDDPEELPILLAEEKRKAFFNQFQDQIKPDSWILTADTLVLHQNRIFGKPSTNKEAEAMLRDLRGITHTVITGYSLTTDKRKLIHGVKKTSVTFTGFSDETLSWYLDSGEWKGVAGAYRIQGKGSCLVASVNGSYSNVVGLPLTEIYGILRSNHFIFR